MKSVLIIPAFNEADRIGAVLEHVATADVGCDVVVVDDGSSDETGAVARRHGARVLRHPFNLGYGAALQTGYKWALEQDADLVVQMDADGQHDPEAIRALVAAVREDRFDLVVGSRFLEVSGYRMGIARTLGRRLFSGLAKLAGLDVSDPTSGFQALNRRVLEVYAGDFFPHDYPDVDVLVAAFRSGLRVGEIPVRMSEGTRASTMHGGLKSFYYVYKMTLSLWSAPRRLTRRDRVTEEPTT
jgi:glycosyltransferase involved in cell wall biosynthesis